MRRFLFPFLATLLVLAVHVSSASACINDRDTYKAEREFKSTYEKAAPAPSPSPDPAPGETRERLLTWGGGGTGVLLLLGAFVLCVKKPRLV
jgi:hypothetical protein